MDDHRLARLAAIEDIKTLKARYFRCMDTKDWTGLAEVFTEDALFDARNAQRNGDDPDTETAMLGEDWRWHGNIMIVAAIRAVMEPPNVSIHHGYMPEIEILSETTARGIWPFEDIIGNRGSDGVTATTLHGYGHYHETYLRVDGTWRIAASRITRLRVDLQEHVDL